MSKKKDILDATLKLFTENGARATSTKSIALQANTSEALIFKHFGSKDGLLEEIIKGGYQEAVKFLTQFFVYQNAQEYLIKTIDLPIMLVNSNFDFWRMQYKILPLNPIAQQYHNNFLNPSENKLTDIFNELGYQNAQIERDLLILVIDGIWKNYVSEKITLEQANSMAVLLKKKYNLI